MNKSGNRSGDRDDELGLGENPLASNDPLIEHFYRRPDPTPPKAKRARGKGRQPLQEGRTYRLVTFSFYEEDVARLDALLKLAKEQGHRRVSRSQIVRLALRQVDLAGLPDIV